MLQSWVWSKKRNNHHQYHITSQTSITIPVQIFAKYTETALVSHFTFRNSSTVTSFKFWFVVVHRVLVLGRDSSSSHCDMYKLDYMSFKAAIVWHIVTVVIYPIRELIRRAISLSQTGQRIVIKVYWGIVIRMSIKITFCSMEGICPFFLQHKCFFFLVYKVNFSSWPDFSVSLM